MLKISCFSVINELRFLNYKNDNDVYYNSKTSKISFIFYSLNFYYNTTLY